MNARTVKFLRIVGIALVILALILLWNWRDGIIDGKEPFGWVMIMVGAALVFVPKAEEPYIYKKEYPTYRW